MEAHSATLPPPSSLEVCIYLCVLYGEGKLRKPERVAVQEKFCTFQIEKALI